MLQNFDDDVKKWGDAFGHEPREWVWPRIEAELDQRKRRRGIVWWWLLPLAIGGIALLFWPDHHNNQTIKNTDKNNIETGENAISKQKETTASTLLKTEIKETESSANDGTVTEKDTIKENAETLYSKGFKEETISNKKDQTVIEKQDKSEEIKNNSNVKDENYFESEKVINSEKDNKINDPEFTALNAEIVSIDITDGKQNITTVKEKTVVEKKEEKKMKLSAVEQKMDTSITPKSTPPTTKKTKSFWTVNFGIGVSNNKERNGLFNQSKAYYSPLFNSGSGGNIPVSTYKNNEKGLSGSIDIKRITQLNKSWNWQLMAGYQLLQMKQFVGTKNDTAVNYADFYRTNSYNSYGTNAIKGTTHRLLAGTSFTWNFISKKSLLGLTSGVYAGVNFSNNYFVNDATNARLIKDKSLYSKAFAGGSFGLQYQHPKKYTAAIMHLIDFTPSNKAIGTSKVYWNNWQLQVGLPFKNK